MRLDGEQQGGILAGIFLAGDGIFANAPDVAQQLVSANTEIPSGFITVANRRPTIHALSGTLEFQAVASQIVGRTVENISDISFSLVTLGNQTYRLKRPIAVFLHQEEGGWIATFAEAELSRSGDTPAEAVEWLQSSIVTLYEVVKKEVGRLGPVPARQFKVLGEYLVKKSSPKG